MLLSFSIAWLLYVFGYIFSPMAQQTLIASDEPLGLERASKIMIWGASVSLIAGIVAAGGVIEKHYIVWASAISIAPKSPTLVLRMIYTGILFRT